MNNLSTATIELILPLFAAFVPDLTNISYFSIQGFLGIRDHRFTEFAICHKCASIKTTSELNADPICHHVTFAGGSECGTYIAKDVRLLSGGTKRIPLQVYAYNSVTEQLKRFMMRPGFAQKLESWRRRRVPKGTFADVYDGKLWSDFQTYKGRPFLSQHGNLALQLNYDGFQPWKRRVYSRCHLFVHS